MPKVRLGLKNGIGNSGGKKGRSGRKSAHQEKQDAERLWRIWTDPNFVSQIKEKIKNGEKLSLEEAHAVRGFEKSDIILNKIFEKLYPDNMSLDLTGAEELKKVQVSMQAIAESIRKRMKGH